MKTKCYHCSGTTWDIISITLIYNSELKSDAKYENVLGTKYNFFFYLFLHVHRNIYNKLFPIC